MSEEKIEKLKVEVSTVAYKKIIYHLLRYPTSKVSGLLVGSASSIIDAYPLFHTAIVNPTLSTAMDLVESNLPSGSNIVGFYEFVEGSEPKINSIIENNSALKQAIGMRVYVNEEKEVRFASSRFAFVTPHFESLTEELKRGDYRLIVDFDAHFEQIQLDFRNQFVK